MLSLGSVASDRSYYSGSENYYDADALGDPYWFGKGAELLGLVGKVDPAEFQRLLDGQLPDGTVLGRVVFGRFIQANGCV